MKKRREEIIEIVESLTENYLVNEDYSFADCCAEMISYLLKIDRSNVSRILNACYKDGLFIRIEGRPTLFISKRIITSQIQTAILPPSIGKEDSITYYIRPNGKTSKPDSNIEIIGIEEGESLASAYQRLIPYFYLSPMNVPILIGIVGEEGSGKKYIIRQCFEEAKRNGYFANTASIEYYVYDSSSSTLFDAIQPTYVPVIVIEIASDGFNAYDCYHKIQYIYQNNKVHPPLVFLISNNSPFSSNINLYLNQQLITLPKLDDRPLKEKIYLVLHSLLRYSRDMNRSIQLPKDALLKLIYHRYKGNCLEIEQVTYSFISSCLYLSLTEKKKPLYLDTQSLPENMTYTLKDMEELTNQFNIPDIIKIDPGMSLEDIRGVVTVSNAPVSFHMPIKIKTVITIPELIFKCETGLESWKTFKDHKNPFIQYLKNSPLESDPNLLMHISDLLNVYLKSPDNLSKFKLSPQLKISPRSSSISHQIYTYIDSVNRNETLNSIQKRTISEIIEHAIQSIRFSSIPILIICKGKHVGENYARHFNMLSKERKFYSFFYDEEFVKRKRNEFVQDIAEVIRIIDRNQGVLVLTDYTSFPTLTSAIVQKTKILSTSIGQISIPLLMETAKTQNSRISTMTTMLLQTQKNYDQYLKQNSLEYNKGKQFNPYYLTIQELFPDMDVSASCTLFHESLVEIANTFGFELNNQTVLDFLFHGNCIIENKYDDKLYEAELIYAPSERIQSLRKILNSFRYFPNIQFTDAELDLLYQSIQNNIHKEEITK